MAIQTSRVEPHWNYFLALDADLGRLARYVEFNERNFECYPVEIARVLLAAAAEVDVVAKQLCEVLEQRCGADNINAYRNVILVHLPEVRDFEVVVPRYGLSLVPWHQRKEAQGVPLWWTANNKVKHERHTEFHQATLKRALNAVGSLLILLLYLYKESSVPTSMPSK